MNNVKFINHRFISEERIEDVLLRIPGNENNREALRELLPDKWAKQTNQNQLDPTWANLGKLLPT